MMRSGQEIYDRWISVRNMLLDQEVLAIENQDYPMVDRIRKDIKVHWGLFKEDLRLATMIKYLEIDVSPKEKEVE